MSDETTDEDGADETPVSDEASSAEADVEVKLDAADETPVDREDVERSAQWTAWQYARHLNDRFDLDELNARLEANGEEPVDLFTWQEVYVLSGETRHGDPVTEGNIDQFRSTIGPNSSIRKKNVNAHLRGNGDPRFVDDKSAKTSVDANDGADPTPSEVLDGLREQIAERNGEDEPSTELPVDAVDTGTTTSVEEPAFAAAEEPFDENEPFASVVPIKPEPVPADEPPSQGDSSTFNAAAELELLVETYDLSNQGTKGRLEGYLSKLPTGNAQAMLEELLVNPAERWVTERPKNNGDGTIKSVNQTARLICEVLLKRLDDRYAKALSNCEASEDVDKHLVRLAGSVHQATQALLFGSRVYDEIFYVSPQVKEKLVPNTPPPTTVQVVADDVTVPAIDPEPAAEPQEPITTQVADPEPVAQPPAVVAQTPPAPELKPQPKADRVSMQAPTTRSPSPVELIPSPPVAEKPAAEPQEPTTTQVADPEPAPAVTTTEPPDSMVVVVTVTDEPEDDSLNPSEPPKAEDPVDDDTDPIAADEDDAGLMAQLNDIFSDAEAGVAEMAELGYPVVA